MNKEKERIRRIQEGIAEDPKLIGDAFEVFGTRVRHFAVKKVGPVAADDIVSQTFLRLVQYHKKFDKNKAKFTTWLHHIAWMECIRWIKDDAKYDRCDDVKLHLSGNETMSVYRRYAAMDSSVHFQVKEMIRKEHDTQLMKLDLAKHKIRSNPDKYPLLNIVVKHRGDIQLTELAKMHGVNVGVMNNRLEKEKTMLIRGDGHTSDCKQRIGNLESLLPIFYRRILNGERRRGLWLEYIKKNPDGMKYNNFVKYINEYRKSIGNQE